MVEQMGVKRWKGLVKKSLTLICWKLGYAALFLLFRQTLAKSFARLSRSPLRTAKNGKAEHVTTNKDSWRWFTQCARVKEEEKESKGRECALQRLLPSPEILD